MKMKGAQTRTLSEFGKARLFDVVVIEMADNSGDALVIVHGFRLPPILQSSTRFLRYSFEVKQSGQCAGKRGQEVGEYLPESPQNNICYSPGIRQSNGKSVKALAISRHGKSSGELGSVAILDPAVGNSLRKQSKVDGLIQYE